MAQAVGSNSRIIYGEEATFGTAPSWASTHSRILPFISESLGLKQNLIRSNAIYSGRNLSRPAIGQKDIGGSIKTELNPYMGIMLKHIMGSVATVAGSGLGTHTFKVGALPVGLTIEKGMTDIPYYFLYSGCRVNKATFTMKSEGFCDLDIDIMGAVRAGAGTSADTAPVALGHVPFSVSEALITEGGSAVGVVTDFNFTIENDLDGGNYVIPATGFTFGQRISLPEGRCTVTGKITALFSSTALLTKALASTETALMVTFSRGDGLGTAGNESLSIELPELIYEPSDPQISGPKGIVIDLPFQAYYDNDSDASTAVMILKNSQTALA